MRCLLLLLALVPLAPRAASLEEAVAAAAPGSWVEYEVPLQPGAGSPCCFERHGGREGRRGCTLDGSDWNITVGGASDGDGDGDGDILRVFARRGAQGVDRVRSLGASCPLQPGAARVAAIGAVDAGAAAHWLAAEAARLGKRERDGAMMALALQAGPAASAALARLAAPGSTAELRRDALFWLGEARGADGLQTLLRTLAEETDAALLRHAVFALSLSSAPGAADSLRRMARHDARVQLRGEALFWLAQDHDPQTEALARAALAAGDGALREKAIFALAQLPPERAIPALDALARDRSQDARTRREALFWLAQQDDDDALAVFDELLGGDPP